MPRWKLTFPAGSPSTVRLGGATVLGAAILLGTASPPDARAPVATPLPATGSVKLQILGVNDFHGHLEPPRRKPGQEIAEGGAAWLDAHLDRAERSFPGPSLRVHAGDMVGASPLVSSHFNDEPTVEAMNLMDFDVGTLGNHEFDEGGTEMRRLLEGGRRFDAVALKRDADGRLVNTSDPAFPGVSFPYVAANTVDRADRPVLPPYAIEERDGVRIGFIGVTTAATANMLPPVAEGDLRFLDVSETVNRYADDLQRQGVEAIVVLAHEGVFDRDIGRGDGRMVEETRAMSDAVDVVIAGHNHGQLDLRIPNRGGEGDKLVVEADSYGVAYDRVRMTIDRVTGDVTEKSAWMPRTRHEKVTPDERLGELVADRAGRVAELGGEIIGEAAAAVPAKGPGGGTLADLMADGERRMANADIALVDPGVVRGGLDAGPVTYAELFEAAAMEQPVIRTTLTGADLGVILDQQYDSEDPFLLHLSGLSFVADPGRPRGGRVLRVTGPGGDALEPKHRYTVATTVGLASNSRFPRLRDRHRGEVPVGTDTEALVAEVGREPSALR